MNRFTRAALGAVAATSLAGGLMAVATAPAQAAGHYPNAGLNRLCNYSTFEALGGDGYHRYVYYMSSPLPGGGRDALWRAYHPNSTGGWNYVGYVGRSC